MKPPESEASSGLSQRELLLELRQDVKEIKDELETKAPSERVHQLAAQVAAMDGFAATILRLTNELIGVKTSLIEMGRGLAHLSDTLDSRIDGRIDSRLEKRTEHGWTTTQRIFGIALVLMQLGTFALLILNYHAPNH